MCMYLHANACSRQGRSFRRMFGLYLLLTVLSCESPAGWKLIVFSTFDDKNSEAHLCSPNPHTEALSSVFIFLHVLRRFVDTDQTLQYHIKLRGQCWAGMTKETWRRRLWGNVVTLNKMILAEVDVEVKGLWWSWLTDVYVFTCEARTCESVECFDLRWSLMHTLTQKCVRLRLKDPKL